LKGPAKIPVYYGLVLAKYELMNEKLIIQKNKKAA